MDVGGGGGGDPLHAEIPADLSLTVVQGELGFARAVGVAGSGNFLGSQERGRQRAAARCVVLVSGDQGGGCEHEGESGG
jgi:hypothetical protein